MSMRNVYLAVVIVITVVFIVGSSVIFLMVRSSKSNLEEVLPSGPQGVTGSEVIEPVPTPAQATPPAPEVTQPSEATAGP